MTQTLSRIVKRAILVMAPFLFFTSCEKPNENLGFDQVIGGNIPADSMAVPITTYTFSVDSILTALSYQDQRIIGGYRGNRLVGSYESPYFGKAEASVVAELLPEDLNIDFGTNPVIDSVNLYLRIANAYGDTSVPMDIKVQKLSEGLSKDSLFYSSFRPNTDRVLGELKNAIIAPNSQSRRSGQDLPAALKIRLDSTYFQTEFAEVGNGSATEFSTFENFLDHFPGIYITSSGARAISYFNLNSALSSIDIHYHNDEDSSLTTRLSFLQDKSTIPIHFNVFDQDYSNASVDLQNQDTIQGEQRVFVQAMGGLATALKLNLPMLDSLREEGMVVNKAFLTLHADVATGDAAAPVPSMEIRTLSGNVAGDRIVDFRDNGGDGDIQFGELRNHRYRFDITRHLFKVIDNAKNPNLAIVPVAKSTVANRSILRGGKDPLLKTRLIIYYTKP